MTQGPPKVRRILQIVLGSLAIVLSFVIILSPCALIEFIYVGTGGGKRADSSGGNSTIQYVPYYLGRF